MEAEITADMIDARPTRSMGMDTAWSEALALRDQIASEIRSALESEKVEALVFTSSNGEYPAWVKLESWMPMLGAKEDVVSGRERSELSFKIHVKPYHQKSLIISAEGKRGRWNMHFWKCPNLAVSDVRGWVCYALGRAGKPLTYPFLLALFLRTLTIFPFIPTPFRNRVRSEFRSKIWLSRILWIVAAIGIFVGQSLFSQGGYYAQQEYDYYSRSYTTRYYDKRPDNASAIVLMGGGLVSGLIAYLISRKRRKTVSVPLQPLALPRSLGLVDSWHTTISGLGGDYEAVKARLTRCLQDLNQMGMSCMRDVYGFRTPNGFDERERVVAIKGQSVVHIHIYRFADDIFIGWDAFLNWAKWDETLPVSRKVNNQEETEYRELTVGFYVPNQFDLIDLDGLSELVHRRLEREVKAIVKEKALDLEIDFTIIRGDRDRALDKSRRADAEKPLARRLRYMLGQQA